MIIYMQVFIKGKLTAISVSYTLLWINHCLHLRFIIVIYQIMLINKELSWLCINYVWLAALLNKIMQWKPLWHSEDRMKLQFLVRTKIPIMWYRFAANTHSNIRRNIQKRIQQLISWIKYEAWVIQCMGLCMI